MYNILYDISMAIYGLKVDLAVEALVDRSSFPSSG